MSRWEKLIKELYSINPDLRFNEVEKILVHFGYILYETSGGSSHATFRKNGHMPVTVPRHGKIKKAYIDLVRQAVEEERDEES